MRTGFSEAEGHIDLTLTTQLTKTLRMQSELHGRTRITKLIERSARRLRAKLGRFSIIPSRNRPTTA